MKPLLAHFACTGLETSYAQYLNIHHVLPRLQLFHCRLVPDLPATLAVLQEPLLGGVGAGLAAGAQGVITTGTLAWALKLVSQSAPPHVSPCAHQDICGSA